MGKIKSSLFYHYNGDAYNAFSEQDIEDLKEQFTSGIHFDSFENDPNDKLFPTFAADEEKILEQDFFKFLMTT